MYIHTYILFRVASCCTHIEVPFSDSNFKQSWADVESLATLLSSLWIHPCLRNCMLNASARTRLKSVVIQPFNNSSKISPLL